MRKLYILGLIGLIGIVASAAFAEELTLTTYYPAPYGVYREMRSQRMAIGNTYYDSTQHCWPDGPCFPTDIPDEAHLVVEGNVGIGTAAPSAKLEISSNPGTFLMKSITETGGPYQFWETADNYYNFRTSAGGNAFTIAKGGVDTDATDDTYTSIFTVSASPAQVVIPNGNVGIGTTSPNVALDVIGSIEYTGTIADVSDERLKENLQPIKNALDKVENINGVYFNMIDTPEVKEIGVIAQEVQQVVPEAVKVVDEENGYLGVSYTNLVPVLIEAIKEQQKQIEELKQDVSRIKREI